MFSVKYFHNKQIIFSKNLNLISYLVFKKVAKSVLSIQQTILCSLDN